MKFYYGNDYKEALNNAPISIDDVNILRQYEENYAVVIPYTDEETLPTELTIDKSELFEDDCWPTDEEELAEVIETYLFDNYDYGICAYDYTLGEDTIELKNMEWDY